MTQQPNSVPRPETTRGQGRRAFLVRIGGVAVGGLAARILGFPSRLGGVQADAAQLSASMPVSHYAPPFLNAVSGRNRTLLDRLTRDGFARHVNSAFRVYADESTVVDLTLTEVTPVKSGGSRGPTESFSLFFHGPAGKPIGQGMYRFEHSGIGAFDLFIVPIGQDRDTRTYEAVFNRLIQS